MTEEVPADVRVMGFFARHAEFRSRVQQRALEQGVTAAIEYIVPIRYRTQDVGGQKWFVKVELAFNTFADVGIFEFSSGSAVIADVKFGVERNAPIDINFFGDDMPSVV